MSLILSGTDGLSDVDGSAATPAIRGTDANTGIFFPAADTIAFAEGGTEAARFDSAGRLLIGQTSPYDNATLSVTSPSQVFSVIADGGLTGNRSRGGFLHPATNVFAINADQGTGVLAFYQNGNTERGRFSGGGYFKASNAGTYQDSAAAYHEFRTNGSTWTTINTSSSSTAAHCLGVKIWYTNATPNGTGNAFIECSDSSADRFQVRSNGGIANFSANNVNLSDARLKTDVQSAGSYLQKICAIPVVTYLYKDQTDTERNLGVLAQDVEAVAPELVDAGGFGEAPEGEEPYKAIYQTDLQYALMKAIQEQQQMINAQQAALETLQAKVAALEAK